ncbi:restriction endonuclease subunit S [Vibrio cholerae]|nr:restriction endonuclease subunit S [Vibrio cholerae]EJL6477640.1 restriction endonuclease subunit S [Vibrio cholerae]
MNVEQIAEVRDKYVVDASLSLVPVGYKKTEAGLIPDDWSATTIGDVTSWLSGGTPSRERLDFWQGNIPWISGSTLKTLEISTSDQHLTIEGVNAGSKMAPLNSTLMLVRGSALHSEIRAGLVVEHVCFNQYVKALIPKLDVLPKFLTIYILAMESELLKLVSSAGNSAGVLDTELVKKFKFLKPSISEQTAIANALSDVDALIQELEKLIAKKQAIKTATMQQLLTGRTRLPQFAHHPDGSKKGYKPSELGEIPEDWSVSPLKELLRENPKYGINAAAVPLEGNLPVYIRITDISEDGYFKPSEKVGVKSPFSGMYQLADGDIVLARTGASVGKSYLYRAEDGILVYAGFLIKISPEQSILEPKFLIQYLKTEQYWSWVTVNSMRSGQPGINGNEYGSLLIPCPTKEEQIAIATILSDMDKDIQSLENRLNKTRQIKQGMMQELLTGKTRLV